MKGICKCPNWIKNAWNFFQLVTFWIEKTSGQVYKYWKRLSMHMRVKKHIWTKKFIETVKECRHFETNFCWKKKKKLSIWLHIMNSMSIPEVSIRKMPNWNENCWWWKHLLSSQVFYLMLLSTVGSIVFSRNRRSNTLNILWTQIDGIRFLVESNAIADIFRIIVRKRKRSQ